MTPRRKQLSFTSRLTIFRSYGAILQSSFDIIIPNILAFNASPPVSVLGTVYYIFYFLHQKQYTAVSVNRYIPFKMVDEKYSHRFKRSFFVCKLSKRPYYLFKDYLHITKPGGMMTMFYTLLFVTYISIGETAFSTFPYLTIGSIESSLFHYK